MNKSTQKTKKILSTFVVASLLFQNAIAIAGTFTIKVPIMNQLDIVSENKANISLGKIMPGVTAYTSYSLAATDDSVVLGSITAASGAGIESGTTCTNNQSIAKGYSCGLQASYVAAALGAYSSGISVPITKTDGSSAVWMYRATATAVSNNILDASPDPVYVSSTTKAGIVTVTNNNGYSVPVSNVSYNTTYFKLGSNTCTGSLDPGASCTISLFKKSSTVANGLSATVFLYGGDTGTAQVASFTAVTGSAVTSANLTVDKTSSYVEAEAGSGGVLTDTFTIKNTGTVLVTPTISSSDSSISLSGCSIINPGAYCTLTASLNVPASPVKKTSVFTVVGPSNTLSINSVMNIYSKSIAVSTNTLDYGIVKINTVNTKQFTVLNNGTIDLNLNGFQLTGTGSDAFSYTHNCPTTLAVGASCLVSVDFKPGVVSVFDDLLAVTFNTANTAASVSSTIALKGDARAVSVAVSPAVYDYGSIPIGVSVSQQFIVTNSAPFDISLTEMNSIVSGITNTDKNAVFSLNSQGCNTALSSGQSCNLTVTFKPLAAVAYTANITLADKTITISGTGNANGITISPKNLDFGTVYQGSVVSAKTVTLTNTTNYTIATPIIVNSGADSSNWVYSTTCGTGIAAQSSCVVNVTFTSNVLGVHTQQLSIGNDSVKLTATVLQPEFSTSSTSLDFGQQKIKSVTSKSIILRNNTGVTANGLVIKSTNSDYVVATSCATTIPSAQQCTITVSYIPQSVGSSSATLQISSTNFKAVNIDLSGSSVAPVLALVSASNSASITGGNSIVYNKQYIGSSFSSDIVLKNTSYMLFELKNSTLAVAPYTLVANTCTTVAPGQTCTVTIGYNSSSVATISNKIDFVDTSGVVSLSVNTSLDYLGVPNLTASPTALDFGTVASVSTTVSKSIVVKNTGTADYALANDPSLTSAGFTIYSSSSTCVKGFALKANGINSCILNIIFKPTASSVLSYSSVAKIDSLNVGLSGLLQGNPTLSVSYQKDGSAVGSVIDFVKYFGVKSPSWQDSSIPLIVKNTGVVSLSYTAAVSGSSLFKIDTASNTCTGTLAPGASCNMGIIYSAGTNNLANAATLVFATNDTGNPTTSIGLLDQGLGLKGILAPDSSSSVSFGSSVVSGTTVNNTYVFKNVSDSPLGMTNVYASLVNAPSGLGIKASTCGISNAKTTLATNASCSVTVSWQATGISDLSGTKIVIAGDNFDKALAGHVSSLDLTGTSLNASANFVWSDTAVVTTALNTGTKLNKTTNPTKRVFLNNTTMNDGFIRFRLSGNVDQFSIAKLGYTYKGSETLIPVLCSAVVSSAMTAECVVPKIKLAGVDYATHLAMDVQYSPTTGGTHSLTITPFSDKGTGVPTVPAVITGEYAFTASMIWQSPQGTVVDASGTVVETLIDLRTVLDTTSAGVPRYVVLMPERIGLKGAPIVGVRIKRASVLSGFNIVKVDSLPTANCSTSVSVVDSGTCLLGDLSGYLGLITDFSYKKIALTVTYNISGLTPGSHYVELEAYTTNGTKLPGTYTLKFEVPNITVDDIVCDTTGCSTYIRNNTQNVQANNGLNKPMLYSITTGAPTPSGWGSFGSATVSGLAPARIKNPYWILPPSSATLIKIPYSFTKTGQYSADIQFYTEYGTITKKAVVNYVDPGAAEGDLSDFNCPAVNYGVAGTCTATLKNKSAIRSLAIKSISLSNTSVFTLAADGCGKNITGLAPGASCTLKLNVSGSVSSSGTYSTVVTVDTNPTLSKTATVVINSPTFELTAPAPVTVEAGTLATQVYLLKNTTTSPYYLNSSNFAVAGATVGTGTSNTCYFAYLAGGASCKITVTYSNQVPGTYPNSINFSFGGFVQKASSSVTVTAPLFNVGPASDLVQDIGVGSLSGNWFVAYNGNSYAVNISSMTTSAPGVIYVDSTNPTHCRIGMQLASGGQCIFLVKNSTGSISATSARADISGSVSISTGKSSVFAVPMTVYRASLVNPAGLTGVAGSTLTGTISITNNAPVRLSNVSFTTSSTGGVVTMGSACTVMAPGQVCNETFSIKTNATAVTNAFVQFTLSGTYDRYENTNNVGIGNKVIMASATTSLTTAAPQFALRTSAYSATRYGASSTAYHSLTNTGIVPVSVASTTFTGGTDQALDLNYCTNVTLMPNQTCQISTKFSPSAPHTNFSSGTLAVTAVTGQVTSGIVNPALDVQDQPQNKVCAFNSPAVAAYVGCTQCTGSAGGSPFDWIQYQLFDGYTVTNTKLGGIPTWYLSEPKQSAYPYATDLTKFKWKSGWDITPFTGKNRYGQSISYLTRPFIVQYSAADNAWWFDWHNYATFEAGALAYNRIVSTNKMLFGPSGADYQFLTGGTSGYINTRVNINTNTWEYQPVSNATIDGNQYMVVWEEKTPGENCMSPLSHRVYNCKGKCISSP